MQGVRSAMLTRPASAELRRTSASWPHSALKEAITRSHELQQTSTADAQTVNRIAATAGPPGDMAETDHTQVSCAQAKGLIAILCVILAAKRCRQARKSAILRSK